MHKTSKACVQPERTSYVTFRRTSQMGGQKMHSILIILSSIASVQFILTKRARPRGENLLLQASGTDIMNTDARLF